MKSVWKYVLSIERSPERNAADHRDQKVGSPMERQKDVTGMI